jgi:hypothetical protein
LFNSLRNSGFPYPQLNKEILIKNFNFMKEANSKKVEFEDINLNINKCDKILRKDDQIGYDIIKSFLTHFFDVKDKKESTHFSVIEGFNNDNILTRVINTALKKNLNINGYGIKNALTLYGTTYNPHFSNPLIAKYIIEKYTKENDIIYDYSVGFGQRLLAALSLPYHIKYIGVNTLEKSIANSTTMFNFYNSNINNFNKKVELNLIGAENFYNYDLNGKINLAFSSPPRFNSEYYEDNEKQAGYDGEYNKFINIFWKSTVNNIDKMLTKD